ncbi:hypothetical protein Bbelb_267450 [Branchiostoma belcheri]|nr:hypothetical protein Bbelb_267450 [Branchiostoma belcheri]
MRSDGDASFCRGTCESGGAYHTGGKDINPNIQMCPFAPDQPRWQGSVYWRCYVLVMEVSSMKDKYWELQQGFPGGQLCTSNVRITSVVRGNQACDVLLK